MAVLDMKMPEMDGVALAREIRRASRRASCRSACSPRSDGCRRPAAIDEFDAQLASRSRHRSSTTRSFAWLLRAMSRSSRPAAQTTGKAETSSLRILLAEDNAVNQKVALRLLEGWAIAPTSRGTVSRRWRRWSDSPTTSC